MAETREEQVFAEALEIKDAAGRAAYLDAACKGDPALRRRLDDLLASHDRASTFLEVSAVASAGIIDPQAGDPDGGLLGDAHLIAVPGAQIGPYTLISKLGEGGMGAVYLAGQERPVRRQVALKIIKPGMGSDQVIARFQAERQALERMDHPNIARVL
ncbi:MAG: pknB 9, partial [Phycisphaerales bacterium]|nr:pknB 9 [Phycisphaerales bacterium]